jgi:hypothetical protein
MMTELGGKGRGKDEGICQKDQESERKARGAKELNAWLR